MFRSIFCVILIKTNDDNDDDDDDYGAMLLGNIDASKCKSNTLSTT